jgi:hydrogenase-4 component B
MTPMPLFSASIGLSGLAALGSLLAARTEGRAIRIAGIGGLLAAVAGGLAGAATFGGPVTVFDVAGPYPFAHFVLRLDALSGLMVVVISALAAVASIYSLASAHEYSGRGVGAMGFFFNLTVAAMMLVAAADNAFWFLVFFEMMSLASYFLVIFDQDEEAVSAGFLYFLIAHAGSVAVMVAFYLMANVSGGFDFAAFRAAHPSGPLASLVFVLALLGFGAKAGMIPLHVWLPRAYPLAPPHASALIAGAMSKIGVFGIVKVGIDLLGGGTVWWGILVLAFGVVSSVLGITYALVERDIKRLLAYSSVENIGIILLGVGTGMIGLATHHPLVAVIGLMAGLYHLVNHAAFKGLLFLGAGAISHRMHTRDMDEMGGLARTMPWTSFCFLIGALAIAAVPPLNGFVSEWFSYQALFAAALDGTFLVRFATPIAATMLTLAGALAVLCFVKAYGEIFCGAPRSRRAEQAREVPVAMVLGMGLLALACVALGLAAAMPPITGATSAGLRRPRSRRAAGRPRDRRHRRGDAAPVGRDLRRRRHGSAGRPGARGAVDAADGRSADRPRHAADGAQRRVLGGPRQRPPRPRAVGLRLPARSPDDRHGAEFRAADPDVLHAALCRAPDRRCRVRGHGAPFRYRRRRGPPLRAAVRPCACGPGDRHRGRCRPPPATAAERRFLHVLPLHRRGARDPAARHASLGEKRSCPVLASSFSRSRRPCCCLPRRRCSPAARAFCAPRCTHGAGPGYCRTTATSSS